MYGYIYKTTNLFNGKIYIGQKKSKLFVSSYYGSGKYLRNSLEKYGKENFNVELLEWCKDKLTLDKKERFWISYYRQQGLTLYNIADGGEGGDICSHLSIEDKKHRRRLLQEHSHFVNLTEEQSKQMHQKAWETRRKLGHDKMSDEQRKKLSESHKGHKHSIESIRKGVETRKGYKHTDETKRRISEGNKGKKRSDVTRLKISQSRKGKYTGKDNHFYGRTHDEKTKQLIGSYNAARFTNRRWINNGIINKRVYLSELEGYKKQGFIEGRIRWKH